MKSENKINMIVQIANLLVTMIIGGAGFMLGREFAVKGWTQNHAGIGVILTLMLIMQWFMVKRD